MLPPSLYNKNLPSEGGPITNDLEEGEIEPALPASGTSIAGNAFAGAAAVSSEGTAAAPGNGVDNDVVMSDAPVSDPPPAAPLNPSVNDSEVNNSNGVPETPSIPVVQAPAPTKEEEKPTSVDAMDTSEDGPAEQTAEGALASYQLGIDNQSRCGFFRVEQFDS